VVCMPINPRVCSMGVQYSNLSKSNISIYYLYDQGGQNRTATAPMQYKAHMKNRINIDIYSDDE